MPLSDLTLDVVLKSRMAPSLGSCPQLSGQACAILLMGKTKLPVLFVLLKITEVCCSRWPFKQASGQTSLAMSFKRSMALKWFLLRSKGSFVKSLW